MKPAIVKDKALVTASDCPLHPKYQAIRPPSSNCETCKQIYDMSHPRQAIVHINVDPGDETNAPL